MLKKILFLLTFCYCALSFAAVEVNQATAAQLNSIKGIGPAISARIVKERAKGSFKDWNDFIARINGVAQVSAAKYAAAGLTVNGAGYNGATVKTDPRSSLIK